MTLSRGTTAFAFIPIAPFYLSANRGDMISVEVVPNPLDTVRQSHQNTLTRPRPGAILETWLALDTVKLEKKSVLSSRCRS